MPPLKHLTPLFMLLLLHRLCPTSLPPSKAASNTFLLYALSTQLLIHRPSSPWQVLGPCSPLCRILKTLVLLIGAHILVFTIYILQYLATCALRVKRALKTMYASLAEFTVFTIENIIAHTSHLKAPLTAHASSSSPHPSTQLEEAPATDMTANLTIGAHTPASALIDIVPQPPTHPNASSEKTPEDPPEEKGKAGSSSPEDPRHPRDQSFTAASFFQQAQLCVQILSQVFAVYIPNTRDLLRSRHDTIMSLYDRAAQPLHIIRIGSILFISRIVDAFCRTSSYLVGLRSLYPPFLAIFSLHLTFWLLLLSIGEMYVLWMCMLTILWMLSWPK